MSRLKLFISILIVAIMSIVFIQNRELIALRLLCADNSSCVYRTPQLPLAIWIGLFILIGALLNLLGQAFNRYSYSGSDRPKPTLDNELYSNRNWKASSAKTKDSINLDKFPDSTNYEVRQEPQNVEHSGSTYSYKYREASDRPKEGFNQNNRDRSIELDSNSEADRDDEDWI